MKLPGGHGDGTPVEQALAFGAWGGGWGVGTLGCPFSDPLLKVTNILKT